MSEDRKVQAKYICLDIEGYTKDRQVRAQLKIRGFLDDIVRECVKQEPVLADESKRIYLPTGDGMCIALLDIPPDEGPTHKAPIHLRLAQRILKLVREYKSNAEHKELEFDVRIGIHSATDYLVKDINEQDNLAGAGINKAFRVMSIADGGQILVSKEVYLELVQRFPHQFWPYEVEVRHGLPLPVYQFHGEADGLNKDKPLMVKDQERQQQVDKAIVKPSVNVGLSRIYDYRNDDVLHDLREDITDARRRVWLLGIGLHNKFDITAKKIIGLLKRKVAEKVDGKKVDVRVLLLDGFRSPAIFRALLESDAKTSEAIVEADRQSPEHPYLSHGVFENFERAYNTLAGHPEFETSVRFYGHTPICWLAIVDDTAYFQPYTFGDISADPNDGFQMPVTRWQGHTTTLVILEDHYNKLWLTSDTDLFLMGTRLKAKANTLGETFKKREGDKGRKEGGGKWLEHVHGILHKEERPGVDRRPHLRLPCVSVGLEATVTWEMGEVTKGEETRVKVIDFSLEGTLLEFLDQTADSLPFSRLPGHHTEFDKEIMAVLDIAPEGGWEEFKERLRTIYERHPKLTPSYEAIDHAVSAVFKTDNNFRFIRKEIPQGKGEGPRVALQARRVGKSQQHRV